MSSSKMSAPLLVPVSQNPHINIDDITIGIELELVCVGFDTSGCKTLQSEEDVVFQWAKTALTPRSNKHAFKIWTPSDTSGNLNDRAKGLNIQRDGTINSYVQIEAGKSSTKGIALEIATPILKKRGWMEFMPGMMQELTNALPSGASMNYNNTCGCHIHIQLGGEYTVEWLRRIAMGVIIFEEIMDGHHDDHRVTNNSQIGSCFGNSELKGKSKFDCIQAIKGSNNVRSIANCMNAGDVKGREHPRKQFKWNFMPIYLGSFGTIECRQGAATTDPEVINNWANTVIKFITASTATKGTDYEGWAIKMDRGERDVITPAIRERFGAPLL